MLDILETLFISAVLFLGINAISARIRVDGHSMEPTLHSGEFIIVNKMAYRFSPVRRSDVIVFHFPRNLEQEYIKRVIGLPGDEVVISNQQVQVNGGVFAEPYLSEPPGTVAPGLYPRAACLCWGITAMTGSIRITGGWSRWIMWWGRLWWSIGRRINGDG